MTSPVGVTEGSNIGKDKHGEGCIGTAYIDWGVTGDFYQNCPSRSIADQVARAFKEKGYHVYVQRMGFGSRRIAEGTPLTYRIHKNGPFQPLQLNELG